MFNDIRAYLFLMRMEAVWHFAHAAACLIALAMIGLAALRVHVANVNALGPEERRRVGKMVESELRAREALDRRRPFAVCFLETIKRRVSWRR
jgi:hypothetical protein